MKAPSSSREAVRYLHNARAILRHVPVEREIYLDRALHIAGYYRGLIYDRRMVKDALHAAQSFIEKVS